MFIPLTYELQEFRFQFVHFPFQSSVIRDLFFQTTIQLFPAIFQTFHSSFQQLGIIDQSVIINRPVYMQDSKYT